MSAHRNLLDPAKVADRNALAEKFVNFLQRPVVTLGDAKVGKNGGKNSSATEDETDFGSEGSVGFVEKIGDRKASSESVENKPLALSMIMRNRNRKKSKSKVTYWTKMLTVDAVR